MLTLHICTFMLGISHIFIIKETSLTDHCVSEMCCPHSAEVRTILGFSAVLAAVLDEFRLV